MRCALDAVRRRIEPPGLHEALRRKAERLLALYAEQVGSSAAAGRGGEDAAVGAGQPAGLLVEEEHRA